MMPTKKTQMFKSCLLLVSISFPLDIFPNKLNVIDRTQTASAF